MTKRYKQAEGWEGSPVVYGSFLFASLRLHFSSFGNATNERELSTRAPMYSAGANEEVASIMDASSNERLASGTPR